MDFIDVRSRNNVFADGIHDDTKALQECLDELKNGGTVFFPDGTYLLSAALIFYSHQRLIFSDNAVVLRSASSDPITHYLLASYSEPGTGLYGGTHDVLIKGGLFDGNKDLAIPITIINTVRAHDIIIDGVRFIHGARWHYIEINCTSDTIIRNCVFDGTSYTMIPDHLLNELIQTDSPDVNSYGPVYNADGALIDFDMGKTPCRNILIENNIFKCYGFPAIGHHGDHAHRNFTIRNNIFYGSSVTGKNSRGYITFMPKVHGVTVEDNVFCDTAGTDNKLFEIKNPDPDTWKISNNTLVGMFTEV